MKMKLNHQVPMIRDRHPEIIKHLSKDKKLKEVIGQCDINLYKVSMPAMDDLIKSIVSQQLSVTAAKTIYTRFINSLDSNLGRSERILSKSIDELRSLGLSNQKANYIQNVVRYFDEHNLHDVDWSLMSDDEIISKLTSIKGVGKWTVEMILMFTLMREDVLPLDDLIIRKHMIMLYKVEQVDKKKLFTELTSLAEAWRPYRSYACRFLWAGKGLEIFNGI